MSEYRALPDIPDDELTPDMRRLKSLLYGDRERQAPPRQCRYLGQARPDLPHSGPCCVPFECAHRATPPVVNRRLCATCKHRETA